MQRNYFVPWASELEILSIPDVIRKCRNHVEPMIFCPKDAKRRFLESFDPDLSCYDWKTSTGHWTFCSMPFSIGFLHCLWSGLIPKMLLTSQCYEQGCLAWHELPCPWIVTIHEQRPLLWSWTSSPDPVIGKCPPMNRNEWKTADFPVFPKSGAKDGRKCIFIWHL